MSDSKAALLADIEKLLNTYNGQTTTSLDPALLAFMDERTLRSIITSLLAQKETVLEDNRQWLEQFKKYT